LRFDVVVDGAMPVLPMLAVKVWLQ